MGCTSIFTCCLFGGSEAVFGDFSVFSLILTNYLKHNNILDVVPSDILVGLNMTRRVRRKNTLEIRERLIRECEGNDECDVIDEARNQAELEVSEEEMKHVEEPVESKTSLISTSSDLQKREPSRLRRKKEGLSKHNEHEVYLMKEAAHFVPFAQAAYTWVSYMLENPTCGIFSLLYHICRQSPCFFRSSKGRIEGDYPWQPHTIALELILGLPADDIVFASYYETVLAIPYYICLDHDWKCVVLAIRGTLTLESVFADINCVPTELSEMGEECGFDGKDLYGHKGMVDSAKWMLEDLKRHGKLDAILAEYKEYSLRVVGHSLGAGVASLISVFLRPRYPNLRCLAFSPPGCTLSEALADTVAEYTTSFIVDDDIIARMTIEGFEELRDSILEMICRIKIPKYEVGNQPKKFDFSTGSGLATSIEESLYNKNNVKASKFKEEVEDFWRYQEELKEENKSNYVKLCLPGSIVHLFRICSNRQSCGSSQHLNMSPGPAISISLDGGDSSDSMKSDTVYRYAPRWAQRSDFEKIEISSHMLLDHDPISVKVRIQEVARQLFGLDSFSGEKAVDVIEL